jgi:hypothetical protein
MPTSSRRISALPRALISMSPTPSMLSASMVVTPDSSASVTVCANAGSANQNASSATPCRMDEQIIVDVRIFNHTRRL